MSRISAGESSSSQLYWSEHSPEGHRNRVSLEGSVQSVTRNSHGDDGVKNAVTMIPSSSDEYQLFRGQGLKIYMKGFPPASGILSKGLLQEEIIKHYPDHLHGKLLLDISTTWQPKEISELSSIKANTLVKRIRAARVKYGGQGRKRASKSNQTHQVNKETYLGVTTENSVPLQETAPSPPGDDKTPASESETSCKFRIEQEEIRAELIEEKGKLEATNKLRLKGKRKNEQWYSEERSEYYVCNL